MKITIIAAMDKNRVIGNQNQLPWHLPADLKHFKTLTLGKPVIMGRKTYESIGRPLPERRNIVLSQQKNLTLPQCEVYSSFTEALHQLSAEKEIMIIGGEAIFKQTLPIATDMYLTWIDHEFTGDTFFPEWHKDQWLEIFKENHLPDDKNAYIYSFIHLQKKH
jgi:dihydrofolate reductase